MNEEIIVCTHGNKGNALKACKSMLYKTNGRCPVCNKMLCKDIAAQAEEV